MKNYCLFHFFFFTTSNAHRNHLSGPLANALLAVFVVIIVLILILVLVKFGNLRKSQSHRKLPKPIPSKDITTWSGLYRFSKAEIENAISVNYKRKSLGRGSAGEVYQGVLPSGQVVAVKQINKGNSSDSFSREVAGLSRIRHPNLVSLLGCCIEGDEQYLVLEYCSAGNLSQHLLSNFSEPLHVAHFSVQRCVLATWGMKIAPLIFYSSCFKQHTMFHLQGKTASCHGKEELKS